jgi:hypothetical protein
LGADEVIDYTKQDFTEAAQIYDVIFDAVGKGSSRRGKRALAENGSYVSVRSSTREKTEDLLVLRDLMRRARSRRSSTGATRSSRSPTLTVMSRKATSGGTWPSSLEADHALLAGLVESGSVRDRERHGSVRIGRRHDMRVMMMVKGDQVPGELPSEGLLAAMGRYNEELTKAGVLLDLAGLHPTAEGVRVKLSGGKTTVVDGPFAEPKEIVAGYWILQVKSMDEAIGWAKRVPVEAAEHDYGQESEIEIRQIFELEEFGKSPAIDRARELEKELEEKKRDPKA